MTERTGSCLCGAVRYRLQADPIATRICWCRDCQKIAGNGTVNMVVASTAIEITGQTAEYASTADSGNLMRRRFCPNCGAHLFSNSSARPQITVVRVGTLEDPSSVRPSANIGTASAPAWACIDSHIDHFDHQPPAPQPTVTRPA